MPGGTGALRRVAGVLGAIALLQAGAAMSSGVVGPVAEDAGLHVPSPDWRDQVIYFAMIDRFDDGDRGNNDQGAGEYDPGDGTRYSGGDLRGLARRLDYMQQLGATALWITPPVANQWLNPSRSFSGYHGYWASDFSAVDAHYGRLDDYRALARALHGRGMYLVQDVVVNHVGDFLACEPPAPSKPGENCRVRRDPTGHAAPVQPPFDRNDPRDRAQRDAGIYHWTPAIADYTDRRQELEHQLAGLDDLDTENPLVRRALRKAYGDWIRDVGVDAFRVDTAFHVPADFFSDFMQATDPGAPGMAAVAAATGRKDFLAFGEGFGVDAPYDDTRARKLDAYMRTPRGLPSMINFPLYGDLGDVFARGGPTAQLGHRIRAMMALHADPWRMPTFVDNHDVDRFLAGGSEAGLKQALLAMLALPGIPVIYYGTEQGFMEQRPAMFATGFGSGGRDHFDTGAPLYRYLQRAIALRRGDTLFSRGTPTVLADNPARSGAIAWRIDGEGGRHALVAFNSADTPMLLDRVATGLPAGTPLRGAFAIEGTPRDLVVGADGTISLVLPAHGGEVWRAGPVPTPAEARAMLPRGEAPLPRLRLDPMPGVIADSEHLVSGRAAALARIQLIVDGDLGHAQVIQVGTDGRWQARLRTDGMIDPDRVHRLLARDPVTGATSDPATFRVALDWQPLADRDDPVGDDTGPNGRYRYPSDPGWRERHPADIHRVRAWRAGGALRLEIGMAGISQAWHPANGFDHVAFTAYLSLPGRDDGTAVMPQQAARLPGDRRWQYRWRAHGWSNLLTRAEGADAQHEGETVTPGPSLHADAAAGTLTVTFPANAFDGIDSLEGAMVYLTTWDYDGGYRALAPEAGPVEFGGGAPEDPRVMDAIDVVLDRDASR
ncbi:alpha-amylase family glycosyl hydrolase [Marilutibacter aestuarii]|uniref:alpha-amylase family glycosyl hydrolase n=1 Tax=Marilutibacter aestuarii TaxID=1706195 RepID=UPI001B873C05|nr:alpha-amylase family glycosyl hydrolase [Lysobacter aestuarii]